MMWISVICSVVYLTAIISIFCSQIGHKTKPDPWWIYPFMPGMMFLAFIVSIMNNIFEGIQK